MTKSPSVNGWDVGPLRVSVGITSDRRLVGMEGPVRESSVTTVHRLLAEVRLQSRSTGSIWRGIVMLHTEQVRGQDKAVPRALR